MLEKLTLETMSPLLNDTFLLHLTPEQTIEIQLVEVAKRKKHERPIYSWQQEGSNAQRDPFNLVFRLPSAIGPQQKAYTISHAQLGLLGDIFLVPIAQDKDGLYFEAVFN
ncbi:MAG: hypothetical protein AAF614_30290 [Chloroflexota bacterium]